MAIGITHGERKIAKDAALDAVAFGIHADRLGDGQHAVFGDSDLGMVIADIFFRGGRQRCTEEEDKRDPEPCQHGSALR